MGCRLLFFSDGVIERRSSSGDRLGDGRFLDYVEQAREVGKLELLRFLMRRVDEFEKGAIEDNVTIIGVDLTPFA